MSDNTEGLDDFHVTPQGLVDNTEHYVSDCLSILGFLEEKSQERYTIDEAACATSIPSSTLRRFLREEAWETISEDRLYRYRSSATEDGTFDVTAGVLTSYYTFVLSTARPLYDEFGERARDSSNQPLYRVNTSKYGMLQNVAESFGFSVIMNSVTGLPTVQPSEVVWENEKSSTTWMT